MVLMGRHVVLVLTGHGHPTLVNKIAAPSFLSRHPAHTQLIFLSELPKSTSNCGEEVVAAISVMVVTLPHHFHIYRVQGVEVGLHHVILLFQQTQIFTSSLLVAVQQILVSQPTLEVSRFFSMSILLSITIFNLLSGMVIHKRVEYDYF